ncbi:MAG: FUSC family protein [Tissierellia bacterium]|nr:FUSC family protein [Tissierellia bacterium]
MNSKDFSFDIDLHIGMRMIKTVIAVFISIFITNLIGGIPLNAAIAAIICLQATQEATVKKGKERVVGTFIGGFFSAIFLFLIDTFDVQLFTNLYYLIMSLLIIPVIKTAVTLKAPDSASSASIVMLITLLSYVKTEEKYLFVLLRVLDTLVGVFTSIIINLLLPKNKNHKK